MRWFKLWVLPAGVIGLVLAAVFSLGYPSAGVPPIKAVVITPSSVAAVVPTSVTASVAAPLVAPAPVEATQRAVADPAGNREVAHGLMLAVWGEDQWSCLDSLWGGHESGWSQLRFNARGSGAYGIPQAKPASKMRSAGADWRTNPATQIKWGLGYIRDRYGTPCQALSVEVRHHSY